MNDSQAKSDSSPAAEPDELLADVRKAVQGDGQAYARIVRRYQQLLGRRMLRFSRDRTQIEELVQDTFVQAYFSLANYRADAPFEHWLQVIATRVGYRFWQRKKRDKRSGTTLVSLDHATNISARPSPSDTATEGQAPDVHAALGQLPPRDRLVVMLMHIEGNSVEETARLTGWTRTMVKVQAFRARGKLKKLLIPPPGGTP